MDSQQLDKYVEGREYYDKQAYKQNCHNKLRNSITKKMRTMMIGFLAELEKSLGSSWGHGLSDNELMDEQLDRQALWKICRNNILDFGNSQIRAVEHELENYGVEIVKNKYMFKGINNS